VACNYLQTVLNYEMTMKTEDDAVRRQSPKAKKVIQRLLANPEFQKDVELFRIKWGVEPKNPKRLENLKKLDAHGFKYANNPEKPSNDDFLILFAQREPYYQDVTKIADRFRLDRTYWLGFVWRYIKYGIAEPLEIASETIPFVRPGRSIDDWGKMPRIIIELGRNSTLRDVKAVWHYVEELRRTFKLELPKFKEWKNFDRDFKIYQLAEQGKSIGEIWLAFKQQEGVDLDFGQIKKIVSEFPKKAGLKRKPIKLVTSKFKRPKKLL